MLPSMSGGAVRSQCNVRARHVHVHRAVVLHTTGHATETVGGASNALHMVKVCLAYSVLHTTPLRHGATHAVTPIMKQGAGVCATCTCEAGARSTTRAVPRSRLTACSAKARMETRVPHERPAQQGDAAWATRRVATGPNRGAVLGGGWEVCGGRLTHGADGSGAGAKD